MSALYIGRHVLTPDGEGVVVKVHAAPPPCYGIVTKAERAAHEALPPERVEVGFGTPVVEEHDERDRRRLGRARTVYAYETVRSYPGADVTPKPAGQPSETLAEFMARKHDPKWKPRALPKPRRLPRLPDEKFYKLLEQEGGVHHS